VLSVNQQPVVLREGQPGTRNVTVQTTEENGSASEPVRTPSTVVKEAIPELLVMGSNTQTPAHTESVNAAGNRLEMEVAFSFFANPELSFSSGPPDFAKGTKFVAFMVMPDATVVTGPTFVNQGKSQFGIIGQGQMSVKLAWTPKYLKKKVQGFPDKFADGTYILGVLANGAPIADGQVLQIAAQ
jgi:hypothetical protein